MGKTKYFLSGVGSMSIVVILLTITLTSCQWINLGDSTFYQSHKIVGERLILKTSLGNVQLSIVSDNAIEVLYVEDNKKSFPSFAIADTNRAFPIDVIEKNDSLIIQYKQLKALISKKDLSIKFYHLDQLLGHQTRFFSGRTIENKDYSGFDFSLTSDEKIIGGGERILGMDRRGHRMPLYNRAHYGYQTESNQMSFSLPAIMSSKKYSILFDNSASGYLDIGKTEKNTLSFEAVGGRMAYVFFTGESYPALINNYVEVTGKQPLPPRWVFGNFASRFGYRSQKQVLDTVNLFEEKDFPLDSIILDLYWFGKDIKGHMGDLKWDKNAFPDPVKMIRELIDKDIKTILVTEPFILSSSSKWQEAEDKNILAKNDKGNARRFDFYFGNTGLIDVFDKSAKNWFSDIYTELSRQGVAGVWGDLGEPEVHPDDSLHYISDVDIQVRGDEIHNAYGHEWAKMVYQNQRKTEPETRPFIMMRSGFAGSQRYGMIPWTGDVDRSWKGLQPQVELSLQMSLFGLAYTHSDLGGFAGGKTFDKEMYIRWLQYGIFQPIYRPHAQDHIAPEPVFHDEETQSIIRDFIKLRYQLLPYNYTLAYQNSTTGMPLMRPLFFEDENKPSLIDEKQNYFWGDAFLVSPIIKANEKIHVIDLPKGVWFDFWDDSRYTGEKVIEMPVTLKTLPVLIRAGSFIPMIKPINNTEKYSSEDLIIHFYNDKTVSNSKGSMYEDDGKDPNAIKNKQYEHIEFSFRKRGNTSSFFLEKSTASYKSAPIQRNIELIIHNWSSLPAQAFLSSIKLEQSNIHFNQDKKILTVRFLWKGQKETLKLIDGKITKLGKPVIYQVFTRLFGNKNTTYKPWGTIEENGVGKFNDFTDKALAGIKEFGVSHVWYTGVPHHAVINDYSQYGISDDDPDIVKGRAGSPYAVKDYYNVNPDLAVDPLKRLEEFKSLIERTHKHDMKVIIDIVPNHIARNYQSLSNPNGVKDFGADDDTSVEYNRDNNFYYIPKSEFKVPKSINGYKPLNGEKHALADKKFKEYPAKWTGNGTRKAQPSINDWYETVKVNYGVKPDGSYDFQRLPDNFENKDHTEHFQFWQGKSVPNSWVKFKDIVLYWTDFGVDGFRYDMAEMVPVEFWSYLNSAIKNKNPEATLIAEVYNPSIYRDYIALGKMDYLYDKVDFYDTLKGVMQGKLPTSTLVNLVEKFADIDEHLLHFLENHDEQRIASSGFAGDAKFGKPAMVVSTLIGKGPTMLYFAQALGDAAVGDAGFGNSMRTTIFDYWAVPSVQRWMNDGKFNGAKLSKEERELRKFYVTLLAFSSISSAVNGEFYDLHTDYLKSLPNYGEKLFSFARWSENEKLIVISNFSDEKSEVINISLPEQLINKWDLLPGQYMISNILQDEELELQVTETSAIMQITLKPLESKVLLLKDSR